MHTPTSIIKPVYKSIVASVVSTISTLNARGDLPAMQYHDWESRGDEAQLPQSTLLGVDGFSFDENQGQWVIRFALGLSSYRDVNLLNEIDILDALQMAYGEGQKVPLLDMDDGSTVSELAVAKFQVLPMSQSELRNYRTIGLSLLRTSS